MGRNNRERRAAKQRKRQRNHRNRRAATTGGGHDAHSTDDSTRRDDAPTGGAGPDPDELARELLVVAAAAWRDGDGPRLGEAIEILTGLGGDLVDRAVGARLEEAVAATWEAGWQPRDLVGVAHRELDRAAAELVAATVVVQRRAYRDVDCWCAPAWHAQVDGLETPFPRRDDDLWFGGVVDVVGRDGALRRAAAALAGMVTLPQLPMLRPPPFAVDRRAPPPRRGRHRRRSPAARPGAGAAGQGRVHRVPRRGRGVHRQGPGAHGPPPHRPGAGRVGGGHGPRRARRPSPAGRQPLPRGQGDPVAGGRRGQRGPERVVLRPRLRHGVRRPRDPRARRDPLHLVARAGRGRAAGRGFAARRRRTVTHPLVPQVVPGLVRDQRVGERLAEEVAGVRASLDDDERASVLPVLARSDEEVERAVEAMFPATVHRTTRAADGEGWAAGRVAADLADLAAGHAVTARG
ncbi:MAG: hypothetical protein U5R31_05060 [Acidimicrobiia bacterium]|nr:hypothetical protein [Acidimicrobiia bacterium]